MEIKTTKEIVNSYYGLMEHQNSVQHINPERKETKWVRVDDVINIRNKLDNLKHIFFRSLGTFMYTSGIKPEQSNKFSDTILDFTIGFDKIFDELSQSSEDSVNKCANTLGDHTEGKDISDKDFSSFEKSSQDTSCVDNLKSDVKPHPRSSDSATSQEYFCPKCNKK